MGLARRLIPCLDVDAGRVVKGVRFLDIRDAGDPVTIAQGYDRAGADEVTFLDITASSNDRDLILTMIEAVASEVFIPLTVGGGVRAVDDVRRLLNAGADKVGINTAAVHDPALVARAAEKVGSQCIVVALDAKLVDGGRVDDGSIEVSRGEQRWEIFTHGGRRGTGIDAIEWAVTMAANGAGELLLTSMDRDGTREGFDLDLVRAITDAVPIPVIASGGVGTLQHLCDGIQIGGADAVLAASIFHFGEHSVGEAKAYMAERGVEVRL